MIPSVHVCPIHNCELVDTVLPNKGRCATLIPLEQIISTSGVKTSAEYEETNINEIDAIKLARDGKSALQSLKNEVRVEYGLGYTHLIFRWVDSDGKKYDEETLIIYGISCKDALALGLKHEQKSIIVKDDKGCKKVVLTDCFDNTRRAVNLEGIYEVYPPRQSYFHTEYSIEKVFENKQIGSIAN